jgi:hypothetical protein
VRKELIGVEALDGLASGRAGHGRNVRYGGFGGQRGESRGEVAALEQGLLVGVPDLFQVPHELGDARGHEFWPTQIPNGPGFRPASL